MSALLQRAAVKASPRRFTGERTSAFAPLLSTDSLTARMARIWSPTYRTELAFEFGDTDCDTGEYAGEVWLLTRSQAAAELRTLRASGAYLERTKVGYYVEPK